MDATVGMGGHSEAILSAAGEGARLIGLDADPDAVASASRRLERFGDSVRVVNTNFSNIDGVMEDLGEDGTDGIIADLGISSCQISDGGRGFSFRAEEPLDMRMDTSLKATAADIVNTMEVAEMAEVIRKYGEERFAGAVASAIVKSRRKTPVLTARSLALIVSDAIPSRFHPPRTHPATRTFQALRMKVNNEMGALESFMEKAPHLLRTGARIVVISFHSLEDRVVKRAFNFLASRCVCPPGLPKCGCEKRQTLKVLTKRPVSPSQSEVRDNPRARSAKIRVAEKI